MSDSSDSANKKLKTGLQPGLASPIVATKLKMQTHYALKNGLIQ